MNSMKKILFKYALLIGVLFSFTAPAQTTLLLGKNGGTGIANTSHTLSFLGDSIKQQGTFYHALRFPVANTRHWFPSTLTGTLTTSDQVWLLNGNTVGSEKWIGAVDNFALPFRTNNTEVGRFLNTGEFIVGPSGSSITAASEQFQVRAATSSYGIVHTDGTRIGGSYIDATGFYWGTQTNHSFHLFYNDNTATATIGTVSSLGYSGSRGMMINSGDQFFVANRFAVHPDGTTIKGTTTDNTAYALKVRKSGTTDLENILTVRNDGLVSILNSEYPLSLVSDPGLTPVQADFLLDETGGTGAYFGTVSNDDLRFYTNNGAGTLIVNKYGKVNVEDTLRVADGSQGAGRILQSDASGNATWIPKNNAFDSTHCWTKLKTDTVEACSPLVLSATNIHVPTASVTVGSGLSYNGTTFKLSGGTANITADLSVVASGTNSATHFIQSGSTTGTAAITMHNNRATNGDALLFLNYGTTGSGNFAGTSVSTASSASIRKDNNGTAHAGQIFITGTPIINSIGTTTTNVGTRLDANGLRIDAISNLHNANPSISFVINRAADGGSFVETRVGGNARHIFSTAASGGHAQILTGNSVDLRLGSTTVAVSINSNGRTFVGGTTTATALLHLGAGTAAASTAPMKWTSGTNQTVAEAGATEYDGTNWYQTNSTAARGVWEKTRVNVSSAGTLTLAATYSDYVFTGTTTTWTLPAVSGNTNVKFYIKNRGSGDITLNSNAGGNDIYNTSAASSLTIGAGQAYILVNDGTYYLVE